VQLRNKAGYFVTPTLEAFAAAAANGDWANAKNFAVNLIDQPGDKSWPIVSATFIELPKDPADPARSAAVMKFFDWAYKDGDATANALDYIPLPEAVKAAVRGAWHSEILTPAGKPVF
jgi:phosphate transport system substrate-binding protein